MVKKIGQNANIWKDKIRIPTIKQTGIEFQCLEGWDNNSNAYRNRKDKIRKPM